MTLRKDGAECRHCKTDRGPPYFGMSFRHVPNFVRNSYINYFSYRPTILVTYTVYFFTLHIRTCSMFWTHDQAKEVNRVDYGELDNCVAKHQAKRRRALWKTWASPWMPQTRPGSSDVCGMLICICIYMEMYYIITQWLCKLCTVYL